MIWKCILGHEHIIRDCLGIHIDNSPNKYHDKFKDWCNMCNPQRTFIPGNEVTCPELKIEVGDLNT